MKVVDGIMLLQPIRRPGNNPFRSMHLPPFFYLPLYTYYMIYFHS